MNFQTAVVILVLSVSNAQYPPTRRCSNFQFECNDGACILKQQWCNARYQYCSDGSDRSNCRLYPNCASDQVDCTKDKKCIPVKWACDGLNDCSDGSDEHECVNGYRIKDNIRKSKIDGRAWLLKQRRTNYGWESQTHRAITALYLANLAEFSGESLDEELMKKQLEIQLSQDMLRGSHIPMHDLALYVHALLSVCLNPRKFQFHDLVNELKKQLEESDVFNPFVALVLCNANSILSSNSVSKLIEISEKPLEPEWIEQKSYAIMTLMCLQNRRRNFLEDNFEDINATDSFEKINPSNVTSSFKYFQRNNGSFGGLYTTALVMQALQAVNDDGYGWNWTRAILYLTSMQKGDGSYDDSVLAMYLVLPVLSKKSLVDLGHVECTSKGLHDRNLTVKEELDSINSIPQRITYTISVGIRKEITFSMTFTIPAKTTFHDAMRLAEELDPRYRFKYVPYSWGNYVYSIFGIVNDPEAGKYWQLYQVKGKRYSLVGKAPDKLITENNGKYAYWFRPTSRIIRNRVDTEEKQYEELSQEY